MAEITVQDIKNKIQALVDVLEHTRQQRDVLLQENARLSENLQAIKNQNEQLKEANQTLDGKLNQVQTLSFSDQQADKKRTEIKGKIRELAAEIDKCIALLNQEK
jgi:septation ring formation regulator EzrA